MSASAINDPSRCQWCGNFHAFKCPMIKAIEYHENGTQKRVEFYAPNDYPAIKAVGPAISITAGVGNVTYPDALMANPNWPGGHGV